jgi:hypothetical protein
MLAVCSYFPFGLAVVALGRLHDRRWFLRCGSGSWRRLLAGTRMRKATESADWAVIRFHVPPQYALSGSVVDCCGC